MKRRRKTSVGTVDLKREPDLRMSGISSERVSLLQSLGNTSVHSLNCVVLVAQQCLAHIASLHKALFSVQLCQDVQHGSRPQRLRIRQASAGDMCTKRIALQ